MKTQARSFFHFSVHFLHLFIEEVDKKKSGNPEAVVEEEEDQIMELEPPPKKLNRRQRKKLKELQPKVVPTFSVGSKELIEILAAIKNFLSHYLNHVSLEQLPQEWKDAQFLNLLEEVRNKTTPQHPKALAKGIITTLSPAATSVLSIPTPVLKDGEANEEPINEGDHEEEENN